MRLGIAVAAGLALISAYGAPAQEPVRVKPVDFDLPQGVSESLPRGVPASAVFVTEDICFSGSRDGRRHFLTCVG